MKGTLQRKTRARVLIGASVLVVLAAALFYVRTGASLTSRIAGATAATPSPSAKSTAARWNGLCPPTEVKLTGVFQECASIDRGMSCPTGLFSQARVLRIHGTKHDFILYVEVNGAYKGPGTYALAPWPNPTLGKPDGIAKVAIREWNPRSLYESTAGSVTIDKSEESGWVYAGLGASTYSPVDVELNLAGWWSCS